MRVSGCELHFMAPVLRLLAALCHSLCPGMRGPAPPHGEGAFRGSTWHSCDASSVHGMVAGLRAPARL